MENFDEYIRQGEPNKSEKAKVWKTAIGLQQVDDEFLLRFLGNLLLGENHILMNREIHVHFADTVKVNNDTVKAQNDTANLENDTINDTINDTVFSLIKQNSKIKARGISERLNISLSTAKRKIKELKEQEIIERIGSDKTGHWKII